MTEAQKLELVFVYLKTVQQGFREVSDALVGHRKAFELRQQLTQLVSSTEDAARLSDLRYRGGVASYLEVLTSQTSFLNAELTLAQARWASCSRWFSCTPRSAAAGNSRCEFGPRRRFE